MIPMVNLQAQYNAIRHEIKQALDPVMDSCCYILGANVEAFEREAADYLGVRHAIGVASGTDALQLALLAEGIGEGDEVITTPFTFIATAEAIRHVGATPVFVDIDPRTFNIDPDAVERAISTKTRAVMVVHLFGQPADMPRLSALCRQHDIRLIEDCCQSFGAAIDGTKTGAFGDGAGFSFFPSKNLGAFGDGGLYVTHSDAAAARVSMLRNHGSVTRYYHDCIGFNSRLDEMQAAVLRVKLGHIDDYNARRRRNAQCYNRQLAGLPLQIPHEARPGMHVYHQYTVLTDHREAIMQALREAGIASAIHYLVPLHRQQAFASLTAGQVLPQAEAVARRCLSLPICPELTEAQIGIITGAIRKVLLG